MCRCVCVCARLCVFVSLRGPVQLSGLVCRWPRWGLLNEIPFSPPVSFYLSLFPFLSCPLFSSLAFSAGFHLLVTSLAASSLSSLHLLRAILGRGEFSTTLFSLSLLLYAPLRAQCGSYTRWLWNEMSLNRAMCPGATVIAGEIQLPL